MKDISIEFTELVEKQSDEFIKKIFCKLDKKIIAKSLKTVDPKIPYMIFKNLPENDSEEIKNLMISAVRIEEIEAAQMEIVNIINEEK
ncbi:MAG: hypothetical protein LBC76_03350 [Treponema sp.]|jgi:flagellar motor switch protein FliG|nr:hypothetical protein [Treponema sp.]